MPTRYVLDAHAWVEYLRGSPPGQKVRQLVDTGSVYTGSATLADVVAHVAIAGGDAGLAARAIQTLSEIVDLDSELALKAAERYARMKKAGQKVSMSQAILQETAKKVGAEIISGDRGLSSGRANVV